MDFPWANQAAPMLSALAAGRTLPAVEARFAAEHLVNNVALVLLTKHLGSKMAQTYYPTTRHAGPWAEGQPSGWVDHYTAAGSTRSAVLWFSSRPRPEGSKQSSAHLVVSPEGEVVTTVNPLANGAFHAGKANDWAIGVEHVNCGFLKRVSEQPPKFTYMDPIDLPYAIEDERPPVRLVVDGVVTYWEPYTTAQFITNIVVKRLFRAVLAPKLDDPSKFTEHSALSPAKKDCGPLWPLEELNALAFHPEISLDRMAWVKTKYMNTEELKAFKEEVAFLNFGAPGKVEADEPR